MITLVEPKTGPCDLEVKQVDKEVHIVRIQGEKDERQLCWACLRRFAAMHFRKSVKVVAS